MNQPKILNYLLIIFMLFTDVVKPYRILGLFPHPGISHFHFFHPIMRGLAEAGHEVDVVSHFPDKNPLKNYRDLPLTGLPTLSDAIDLEVFKNRQPYSHFLEFFLLNNWGRESCENALNSTVVQNLLRSKKKYDVIIMEQFNSDCMTGVGYKLNAPYIALSSCALMPWHYNRFGVPHIPSYIPALFVGNSENMNFKQRLGNWITVHGMKLMYSMFADSQANELMQKYLGKDLPDVKELSAKTSLMFVNQHYSMGGSKPLPPPIIEIGGVHIQEPKTIDAELQQILDTAEHGVIYISWGSMIRAETLPAEKRDGILQAFAMLPQQVIWKWENETLPNQPSNVFIRKWMPQREILCHPKVRVFMSHGGLLGSSEAAYCGVPVVATPMYGDQFLNSAAMVHRGMAKLVQYEDISKENIYAALKMALEPTMAAKAKEVSFSYKNRPETPLKTAVWWVEHVAATKGAPLTGSKSTELPWYVYHSLDVYAVLVAVFTVTLSCWVWILKRVCGRKNTKTKSKSE